MELAQLLKERRSVQLFEDRPVSVKLITQLLDTSVWVPNHRMTQPWRFVLVHGDGVKRIAQTCRSIAGRTGALDGEKAYNKMIGVPALLTVAMRENPNLAIREEDYASTSCIIHNFSLLAWEKGIGTVWKTPGLMHQPEYREAFGIQPGEKLVGTLHIGYPAKIPAAQPRIPAEQLLTIMDS
ncbi:nitroreductase family protein [Paenibacillus abyssi]|uniref:Putative NAD(P)H nitroreductase n=1 Tax=Paenibacillus abyssi TaxID=1340531 RepID=A0A917CP24_9BACL|nr:nitroreductase [Paenibacillus abyssi]GGF92714.1 nitroreductase [Paenibacillus abyssi]